MQVKSIVECSTAILLTCIKQLLVLKIFFCLLLSGHLRQDLLYMYIENLLPVLLPKIHAAGMLR